VKRRLAFSLAAIVGALILTFVWVFPEVDLGSPITLGTKIFFSIAAVGGVVLLIVCIDRWQPK
jgi:hypothetical protein